MASYRYRRCVPMNSMNVLVVGSTGNQGRAVIRQLLRVRTDFDVHGLTRDPTTIHAGALRDIGVTTVTGDLNDPDSFDPGLGEMDAVFGMTHSAAGYEREREHGITLADAATDAGVDHFVFSSVIGANQAANTEHFDAKRAIERHLEGLDLPTTVLRPAWFMFNVERSREEIRNGQFALPLEKGATIQMLDPDDYGRFIARIFMTPKRYVGAEIDIAGVEYTLEAIARVLTNVTGEAVEPVYEPVEDCSDDEFAAITRQSSAEEYPVSIAALEQKHDIEFTTFEQYLREHDWNNS